MMTRQQAETYIRTYLRTAFSNFMYDNAACRVLSDDQELRAAVIAQKAAAELTGLYLEFEHTHLDRVKRAEKLGCFLEDLEYFEKKKRQ
jgi:prephenate dehydratase